MANRTSNMEKAKKIGFGVEIEMSKIGIEDTVRLIARYYYDKYGHGINVWYGGGYYKKWYCTDHKGRKWTGMTDGSSAGRLGSISCEMVTPLLNYEDIPDLQEIVRKLREAGAKSGAGYNAGVHIHVDGGIEINGRTLTTKEGGCTAKAIRNLINLINSHYHIIHKAVSVTARRDGWCAQVESGILRRFNAENKPQTLKEAGIAWYGTERELNSVLDDPAGSHYHSSRYQLLNVHSLWTGKGFEFRCFEFHKGLHAGELKAWIQMCLAMVAYAKDVRYSRPEPIDMTNEKYAMNSWMKNMGLIGDEFSTCRKHMLKRLNGDPAYRNGRPQSSPDDLIDLFEAEYTE